MMATSGLAWLVIACSAWLSACNEAQTAPTPVAAPAPAPTPAPAAAKAPTSAPSAPAPCAIDPKHPGATERGGRARIQITGPGVSIDASNVPALCGSMYNQAASALGMAAGEGLLFRTCLPDGVIQISSDQRVLGKQVVHAGTMPRGTDVLFEKDGGSSYSTIGSASDMVVTSLDFAKVEASVELHEVEGDGVLRAKLVYDCSADERVPDALPPPAAAPAPK